MSINKDLANATQEQEFTEIVNIIVQHRSKASRTINEQSLLCAWYVGGYVSKKLKNKSGKTKCARFEKRNVQKSGKTKRSKKFAHTTL